MEINRENVEEQGQRTCFKIQLNRDIGTRNFIGCLTHYFMLSFIFVSVDSLQPMLLQQKFNIQKKESIENFKNVIVIAFDITVKLIAAPIFGYLADRKGRKLVNLYGIIWIGVTMMLMPYAGEFWQYVLLRCFYAQGAIAIAVIPLLADYVSPISRGSCAAVLVFMSSVGAVSSAFLNFNLLKHLESDYKINYQYGIASLIILILGVSYSLICLKSGNIYYVRRKNDKKSPGELLEIGLQSMKKPEIATGYIAAFLARSDSILLSLYLVLWTYSFEKKDFDEANSKASALSGITYTIIMLTCIVYGLLYGRKNINKRNLLLGMLVLVMFGTLLINFSTTIDSFYTYAALSVLGIGMSGLLTSSLYLVNEYATPEHRGYITGIQTWFGIIGITLQTFIGALLYEYWNRNGPFNYFGIACFLCILLTIYVYYKFGKNAEPTATDNNAHVANLIEERENQMGAGRDIAQSDGVNSNSHV